MLLVLLSVVFSMVGYLMTAATGDPQFVAVGIAVFLLCALIAGIEGARS